VVSDSENKETKVLGKPISIVILSGFFIYMLLNGLINLPNQIQYEVTIYELSGSILGMIAAFFAAYGIWRLKRFGAYLGLIILFLDLIFGILLSNIFLIMISIIFIALIFNDWKKFEKTNLIKTLTPT